MEVEAKVAVNLQSFRNLELFKQGIYQLKLRVYYYQGDSKVYATPEQVWEFSYKNKKQDPQLIICPGICSLDSSFYSKGFLIRYQEETIVLNEVVVFSLQVPLSIYKETSFFVSSELLFSNLEKKEPKDRETFRLIDNKAEMKIIGSKEFLVKKGCVSANQYVPIMFGPDNFCIFESLVHFAYIGYQKVSASLVFGKKFMVGVSETDRVYSKLLDPMKLAYENLRSNLASLSRTVLNNQTLSESLAPELHYPLVSEEFKESFYEAVKSHDPEVITEALSKEIKLLSSYTNLALERIIQLAAVKPLEAVTIYLKEFNKLATKHFHEYITIEPKKEFPPFYREHTQDYYLRASEVRISPYYIHLEKLPIQATDFFNLNELHPIFFLDHFSSNLQKLHQIMHQETKPFNRFTTNIHVMVLVHGYRGTHMDMHVIRSYLFQIYPKLHVFSSRINESMTDNYIGLLGTNLAREVEAFIRDNRIPRSRLKLSFLSHSLGGVIVRAALPFLEDFKDCMHSFISLAGPHLGVGNAENLCIEFGKWLLKKFQGSISFSQLTLHDASKIEDTYLYQLSKNKGLSWFDYVLFFSCADDPFVPEDTARIQVPKMAKGTFKEKHIKKMVKNIIARVNLENFFLVDVHFKHQELLKICICCGNRHIDFLDNSCFLKMLCYSFPGLFTN